MNADTIGKQDAKGSPINHQRIHIDRRQALRKSAMGVFESTKYKLLPPFFCDCEWLFGLCCRTPGAILLSLQPIFCTLPASSSSSSLRISLLCFLSGDLLIYYSCFVFGVSSIEIARIRLDGSSDLMKALITTHSFVARLTSSVSSQATASFHRSS